MKAVIYSKQDWDSITRYISIGVKMIFSVVQLLTAFKDKNSKTRFIDFDLYFFM